MFEVVVQSKNVGSFPSFTEALRAFYGGVGALVKSGTALMIIETGCWIEYPYQYEGEAITCVMHFPEVVDFCIQKGLLVKGKLNEPLIEPPLGEITDAFIKCQMANAAADRRIAEEIKENECRESGSCGCCGPES